MKQGFLVMKRVVVSVCFAASFGVLVSGCTNPEIITEPENSFIIQEIASSGDPYILGEQDTQKYPSYGVVSGDTISLTTLKGGNCVVDTKPSQVDYDLQSDTLYIQSGAFSCVKRDETNVVTKYSITKVQAPSDSFSARTKVLVCANNTNKDSCGQPLQVDV